MAANYKWLLTVLCRAPLFAECLALDKVVFAECISVPRVLLSINVVVTGSRTLPSVAVFAEWKSLPSARQKALGK